MNFWCRLLGHRWKYDVEYLSLYHTPRPSRSIIDRAASVGVSVSTQETCRRCGQTRDRG